jgi:hypothetical protein
VESIEKKGNTESSIFLFKAQQIEKSESGPSFWRVQIWNDRSQKPKKNCHRVDSNPLCHAQAPVGCSSTVAPARTCSS